MKVVTPLDVKNSIPLSSEHVSREQVDAIISSFNEAMLSSQFHYNSTEKTKFIYICSSDISIPKMVVKLATEELTAAGWDVRIGGASCCHGGFNAIVITLP